MRSLWRWYNRHFQLVQFGASIAFVTVLVYALEATGGDQHVAAALKGNRQALYTALISTGGSLLGFIITTVSIVATFGQLPRFNLLREAGQYNRALGVYFQAILWLAITTLWALIGLLLDTDSSPRVAASYLMLWLVIISSLRVKDCVWLLRSFAVIAAARPAREI